MRIYLYLLAGISSGLIGWNLMRIYLYLLAGISSGLIGWNLSQFIIADLGLLKLVPEIVIFPCLAISLAIGMVSNEIFISNPTRVKLSFLRAKIPVIIAVGLGLVAGSVAGGISQILFLVKLPTPLIRTLGWLLIGSSVGLAEGLTWRWHSVEAGNLRRYQQRFITSMLAASGSSLVAALLFELMRIFLGNISPELKAIEDPLGFSILGLLLGLVFSITNSPSYLAALRAGAGFEYTTNFDFEDFKTEPRNQPHINSSRLRFVGNPDEEIEEGLSIELPPHGKITIGSDSSAHICIPGLPPQIAHLDVQARETLLIPNREHIQSIEVNGEKIAYRKKIALKHNYILTFYSQKQNSHNEEKIYRFVYYNRFLDPQA